MGESRYFTKHQDPCELGGSTDHFSGSITKFTDILREEIIFTTRGSMFKNVKRLLNPITHGIFDPAVPRGGGPPPTGEQTWRPIMFL